MFPLTIYWVHSSCAQILKMINRMGQSDRIKRLTVQLKHWRPLHTVLCTACPPSVGWEDSDYFSGLSDLHVLFRVCSSTVTAHIPGRAPVDVVFFIRSLQMVHSSTRGSVCFLSSVCEGCSSGRETVCVWGGVQVGLIMHRQQWLQWSSEDDLRTVRLCDVSVGSSRDREEQAHAETICQLQILWQTFS